MKFKLVLILSLSVWIQANNDAKELETDKIYQNIDKQFSEALKKARHRGTKLLIPTDMGNTLKMTKKYKRIYKTFIEDRKELKISNKSTELYTLYLNTFETISYIKLTDTMQFIVRSDYEMRILKRLKKDFIEELFIEEKNDLISNLKDLLLLDKFSIYETQRNLNIFYANNMKQYFSIMTEIPLNLIEAKSNRYQNFMNYLNKGEALILEGLKQDDFTNFKKFVDELEVSKSEVQNLVKIKDSNPTEFSKLYLDYWVRGQVYGRYLGEHDSIIPMIRRIEKEKEFFETL